MPRNRTRALSDHVQAVAVHNVACGAADVKACRRRARRANKASHGNLYRWREGQVPALGSPWRRAAEVLGGGGDAVLQPGSAPAGGRYCEYIASPFC